MKALSAVLICRLLTVTRVMFRVLFQNKSMLHIYIQDGLAAVPFISVCLSPTLIQRMKASMLCSDKPGSYLYEKCTFPCVLNIVNFYSHVSN